ncbi:hypothetical protein UC34_17590 [Pandoraea vervacti]|uniref:Uncharacterized protein n=1 Tax=Pandoraea vervacti TaxID=656178 RepID=A0ABM5T0A7_9BURK|nr:hypothetical protein [Pandoraea vervacti]AJP58288.1 hypothetical protein UC34_17590 [Pandoraea vervacti]
MNIKRKAPATKDETKAPTEPAPQADIDQTFVAPKPPDFPDDAPPFNLVKIEKLTEPLQFRGPLYPKMYAGWYFRVYCDGELDQTEHFVTDDDIANNYVAMQLAPDVYVKEDGLHSFTWDCHSDIEFDYSPAAPPTFYTLDTEAPGLPMLGELEFPDDVHENGLSDVRLTELGNVLPGEVPGYYDRLPGDVAVGIVRNLDNEEERTAPHQIKWGESTQPFALEFTRAMLTTLGDGLLTFTYEITDIAGNTSEESEPVTLEVFLRPGIEDLEPPIVPLFDDDDDTAPNIKLIDEADARTPVEVHIPGHAEIETGDVFVVWWGTREQPQVTFTGADGDEDVILQIPIPYGEVSGEWGDAQQDEDGFATIPVTYVVYRANKELGRPAAPHDVVVNLSQAGGVDPDPETPENEALGFPYVHNFGWQDGDRVNHIPDATLEEDHKFYVPFFTVNPDGTPSGIAALKRGDNVIVTYNGTAFDERTVSGPEEIAEQDMEFDLPWQTVKAAGSGIMPIQYSVIRYVGVNLEENVSVSRPADVEVEDSTDIPGGPDGLLPARFDRQHVVWGHVSEELHAPLTVKAYVGMRLDDKVRVHVTANEYDPPTGVDGPPYPRAEWGGDAGLNPHDFYLFELVVTPENLDKDLKFGWPLERAEWTYDYGKARITYTVTRPDGTRARAPADTDQRTDMSGRGKPPEEPAGSRSGRMTYSEAKKAGARNSPERLAALSEFVRQYRSSPGAAERLRQRRMAALKARPVAPPAGRKLTSVEKRLRHIALRPIPKTEQKA